MKYIYYLPDKAEDEQHKGIKDYLSHRGIFPGDCTILQSDYRYDEDEYEQGIKNIFSRLECRDTIYVWDFAYLAKSLEGLYTILLLGINQGASIIQCLDGTIASNESSESKAIVNAIGIASRIELKVSKVQKILKYKGIGSDKRKTTGTSSPGTDPNQIIVRRYSPKAIIVCGNTKKYKDAIHEIGGLFYGRIDNGKPGWILSCKKLNKLQEVLAGADYVVLQDCYISKEYYSAKHSI